jgi:5S rRNA maturation endonuclease (ribonuclease M5)
MSLPQELLDACKANDPIGTIHRVVHKEKQDGTTCSEGKDSCLSVRRITSGWLYHCFRCGYKGRVALQDSSPSEVLNLIRATAEPLKDKVVNTRVPEDAIPVLYTTMGCKVCPDAGRQLLLAHRLDYRIVNKYGIVYSPSYHRLIFPVWSTKLINDLQGKPFAEINKKIIGWSGRDPFYTRASAEPKWLTRRNSGIENLMMHISVDSPIVVLVEDAISAIRIHEATGYQTIALLGTWLPSTLIARLKGQLDPRVIIWLDSDAVGKTINYWKMCNTLNLKTTYVNSSKDPKCYDDESIRDIIGKSKVENENHYTSNKRWYN